MNTEAVQTLAQAWPIWLSAVALLLQAVINQPGWTPAVKKAVAVGVAGVLAAVYAVASGQIPEVPAEWVDVLVHWLIVGATILVIGQAVYGFLKTPLAAIENTVLVVKPDTTGDGGLADAGETDAEPSAEPSDS